MRRNGSERAWRSGMKERKGVNGGLNGDEVKRGGLSIGKETRRGKMVTGERVRNGRVISSSKVRTRVSLLKIE
jgi:hypothetical protein